MADQDNRQDDRLFRTMYETTSVGISRVTLDYTYQDVNDAFCRFLGYTREELLGMPIWETLDPDIRDDVMELQDQLRDGKIEILQSERTFVHKDGHVVWGLLESNLVRDESGTPLYFLGNTIDITERKQTESDLRKLLVGVEQSPVAIVITDLNGTIEYVNRKFCAVSGYSRYEAVGQNPRVLKSGEQGDAFYSELWKTIMSGGTWQGEFHNKRKDGSLYWEEATIGPITNESGEITHFIAFKEDVTQKKDLELQLLQSQRLEAIGQLAGGIAHDFNNLLTVINGYSTLVLDRFSEDDPARADIEQIISAGERAGTLTHQLLAFSRKQLIRLKVVNLNTLVEDMTVMLRRLVGENIDLRTNLSPNLGAARVDPVQINQILMNLVVNSRDALPDGGQVVIETEDLDADRDYERSHGGVTQGRYCVVSVTDNGVGMDAGTQAHAFDPFFTTKGVGEGTGLGLSTVYGIVKQHNGHVWLQSEPGRGTTVKIYLPRIAPESPQTAVHADSGQLLSGTETILLVEDDETVRGLTAGILERAGYTVIQAPDGSRALELFRETDQAIDLLITDVIMPGMGGKELADRIVELAPGTRVIFVSGYTDDAISRAGILRDDVELLSKPFHPSVLLSRVRSVLDQSDSRE